MGELGAEFQVSSRGLPHLARSRSPPSTCRVNDGVSDRGSPKDPTIAGFVQGRQGVPGSLGDCR